MTWAFEPDRSDVRPGPRASLITAPAGTPGQLWMGGTRASRGTLIAVEHLRSAMVIDCAGDLPEAYRAAAGIWVNCILADLAWHPGQVARLSLAAREAARHLAGPLRPASVFVFCQYGMNRSGLMTGLILRELGMDGVEAVGTIREGRPGALSSLRYRDFVSMYDPSIGGLPPRS